MRVRRLKFSTTKVVDGERITEEYDFEINLPSGYALRNAGEFIQRLTKVLRDFRVKKGRRVTRDMIIELVNMVSKISSYDTNLCSLVATALRMNPCYAWNNVLNNIAYNIMKLSVYVGNDGWLKSAVINNADGWGRTSVFFPLFEYERYSFFYKRRVTMVCGAAVTSWRRSRKVKGGKKITYKGFVSFMCAD